MSKLPLKSKIIEIIYRGYEYSLEKYYYEGEDPFFLLYGQKYTTELDSDFFDRLDQLHRDRKIDEILKKN